VTDRKPSLAREVAKSTAITFLYFCLCPATVVVVLAYYGYWSIFWTVMPTIFWTVGLGTLFSAFLYWLVYKNLDVFKLSD